MAPSRSRRILPHLDTVGGAISPILTILGAGLVIATATDIQSRKVPNELNFGLMAVGIAAQWYWGAGVLFALQGIGLAFVLHYALYVMKLEGAGDAKLMMAVGALLGWQTMLESSLWRYVFNIPYAIAVLTYQGRWENFKLAAFWTYRKAQGAEAGERPEPTYMPFAPLILIGTIAALSTDWLDFF